MELEDKVAIVTGAGQGVGQGGHRRGGLRPHPPQRVARLLVARDEPLEQLLDFHALQATRGAGLPLPNYFFLVSRASSQPLTRESLPPASR